MLGLSPSCKNRRLARLLHWHGRGDGARYQAWRFRHGGDFDSVLKNAINGLCVGYLPEKIHFQSGCEWTVLYNWQQAGRGAVAPCTIGEFVANGLQQGD